MALTPGGRSPSAPPSPPSPSGSNRPTRDIRSPSPPPPQVALSSVVRWGVLIGGLIIIADLATRAVQQRGALGADVMNAIDLADLVVNIALFSFLGAAVLRETGMVYMAALAGLLAGLLDGLVVAASVSLAPRAGDQAPEEHILWNLVLGTLFAALSAGVNRLMQRRIGRR